MKLHILILILITCLAANVPTLANTPTILQQEAKTNEVNISPKLLLRSAKSIYVESDSIYFESGTLENALRKNSKFEKLGFILTRDKTEADIIIEVQRVVFTPVFTFRAFDRKTQTIVATGKATSIVGLRLLRSASSSMASQFLNQALKAQK
ncbi:MAG: hypothetical protein HY819_01205 [Acidobacteria bacterium]|nr:hypothetical protein [Acidobacteriota bacterium]